MILCKYCNTLKNENDYYKNSKKKCKECVKKDACLYKQLNSQKKKSIDAIYYKNNKDKFKKCNDRFAKLNPNYKKEYRNSNKEYYNNKMKLYQRTIKHKESSYYSRRVLIKLGYKNPSKELINTKIELMKINRLIKQKS